ncbi:hypothetical protein GCM10022221_63530 [Actinocorallia aurea]
MRRALATTTATIAGVVLLLSLKPHHASLLPATSGTSTADGPSASAETATQKTNGTFQGDPVLTRFGPVQVSITLQNGELTGVDIIQVPSENGRDREIASFAVPILTREAIAAGTARIDTVSGATYTSEGYIGSLQSALDRAGA